jgi:hypothetical protein
VNKYIGKHEEETMYKWTGNAQKAMKEAINVHSSGFKTFQKKIYVSARQLRAGNIEELKKFLSGADVALIGGPGEGVGLSYAIRVSGMTLVVRVGSWIVVDEEGQVWNASDAHFRKWYEQVEV